MLSEAIPVLDEGAHSYPALTVKSSRKGDRIIYAQEGTKARIQRHLLALLCRASGSCADDAWAPDMEAVKEGDEEGSPERNTLADMSALSFRPAKPSSPPATLTQVRGTLVMSYYICCEISTSHSLSFGDDVPTIRAA